jgi:hypothetical protein
MAKADFVESLPHIQAAMQHAASLARCACDELSRHPPAWESAVQATCALSKLLLAAPLLQRQFMPREDREQLALDALVCMRRLHQLDAQAAATVAADSPLYDSPAWPTVVARFAAEQRAEGQADLEQASQWLAGFRALHKQPPLSAAGVALPGLEAVVTTTAQLLILLARALGRLQVRERFAQKVVDLLGDAGAAPQHAAPDVRSPLPSLEGLDAADAMADACDLLGTFWGMSKAPEYERAVRCFTVSLDIRNRMLAGAGDQQVGQRSAADFRVPVDLGVSCFPFAVPSPPCVLPAALSHQLLWCTIAPHSRSPEALPALTTAWRGRSTTSCQNCATCPRRPPERLLCHLRRRLLPLVAGGPVWALLRHLPLPPPLPHHRARLLRLLLLTPLRLLSRPQSRSKRMHFWIRLLTPRAFSELRCDL